MNKNDTIIKFIIATHKKYWFPSGSEYLPLQVGSIYYENLGIIGDCTGDNISNKNANYCELTGLYWAWKNIKCDIIGICHYRRYFDLNKADFLLKRRNISASSLNQINKYTKINGKYLCGILNRFDLIAPAHEVFVDGLAKQYNSIHRSSDFDTLIATVLRLYPQYEDSLKDFISLRKVVICNMFICKKGLFDEYMKWLMSILFEVEKEIDISDDSYQSRVFGFMGERLLNWYILQNHLKVKEVPMIKIEDDNSTNSINFVIPVFAYRIRDFLRKILKR